MYILFPYIPNKYIECQFFLVYLEEKSLKSNLKYEDHITNVVSSQLEYSCIQLNKFIKYETITLISIVQAHINISIVNQKLLVLIKSLTHVDF